MTSRVLVTARCRRGHVLTELLPTPAGMRVRVRDCAAGHMANGRVNYRGGGPVEAPLSDAATSYLAMCACGRPHLVAGRDLAKAAAVGDSVISAALLR